MRMKYLLPVAAVISMASAPAMAAPVQVDRAATSTTDASELGGRAGAAGFLIGLLAIAAIVAGILAATKGKDRPNSP